MLVGGISCRPFRAQKEALFARHFVERRGDRGVRHCDRETSAFPDGPQYHKVADGLRYANSRGDRVRILPTRRVLLAGLERFHHWRTACGLHSNHPRALFPDEADSLELSECLPHTDQTCATAGRIENRVRHLPSELFDEFETHRLFALDPVGLLQGRRIEPAHLGFSLTDDLAAVIDQTIDSIHSRTLQSDLAHVHFRRILRAEDRRLDTCARSVGRKRGTRVAVRRHRHVLYAERLGHRNSHDQAARLEGACR